MKTVEVNGGTVMLRERADLRVKDRRMLQEELADVAPILKDLPFNEDGSLDEVKALEANMLTKEVLNAFYRTAEVAIAARVAGWSFSTPVPTTMEDVENLPVDLYDALSLAVTDGIQDMLGDLDFEPSDPRAPGFSETPTQPSAA